MALAQMYKGMCVKWLKSACSVVIWACVGGCGGVGARCTQVGLHFILDTLVWESAYLMLPYVNLIFQFRTEHANSL